MKCQRLPNRVFRFCSPLALLRNARWGKLSAIALLGASIGMGYAVEVRGESRTSTKQMQAPETFVFQAPTGSGGGRPNKRRDGGSRGACKAANMNEKEKLTALIPEQESHSLTVDAQPTFWFYVHLQQIRPMQLILRDEDYREIETVTLTPNAALPGVIRVPLTAPLNVGKQYNWAFTFECQGEEGEEAVEFLIEGVVERVSPSEELMQALEEAKTERDRVAVYAQNGMWFDALTLLGNLQRSGSRNAAAWAEFLGSVGLDDAAKKPIVDCCRPQ